jgi:hypothetical protein
LEALTPAYLAYPPVDPFTGELLRYQPRVQGYRLYSTGMDMTDNGGASDAYQTPGSDLVFR